MPRRMKDLRYSLNFLVAYNRCRRSNMPASFFIFGSVHNKIYITMRKKVTAHNYVLRGFVSDKPSLTIPGQVHPIRTIIERFRRGQGVQAFPGVYNPDFPPGYENLDKIEKIEFARENASRIASMREKLAKEEAKEKALAADVAESVASKSASKQEKGQ